LPRVEPVEKRGSRPADVEVTGRRRGETDTNGLVGALLWGHGAGKPIPALAVSQAERRSGSTHRRAKKKEFTAGAPLIPEGRRRSSPQGLHSSRREEEGVHRRGSTHRGGKKKGFTAEDAE